MPTTLINAETKIPQLLLDYVDSRRTALSIPASTALPFYAGVRDAGSARAYPCVVFYCESFEMKHPEKMLLSISVDVINHSSYADSSTENSTASKVRAALADIASWNTWLAALTTNEKDGWRVIKTRVTGGGISLDAEAAERRRSTTLAVSVITSETTFPA